ncbi:MAG: DUF4352 domain-containing protein [Chloroflexi bacterium]|nr:DUF4352 domain-containing protein [Chloroflexota bacterium]
MGKIIKFGCGGLVVLVVVFGCLAVIAGGGTAQKETKEVAKLNEPVRTKNWVFTVLSTERADSYDAGLLSVAKAQGQYVEVRMKLENVSNQTSQLNSWDFNLFDSQGRKFAVVSSHPTISIFNVSYGVAAKKGLPHYDAQVQLSLSVETLIVFDIPPDDSGLVLEVQGGKRIALE